jgi:hypothetical protein
MPTLSKQVTGALDLPVATASGPESLTGLSRGRHDSRRLSGASGYN